MCSWLKDLVSGLVFLEKHCVVHRDLKLGNLLQSGDGRIIICDFGKAMLMDDSFTMEYKYSSELVNCKRALPGTVSGIVNRIMVAH